MPGRRVVVTGMAAVTAFGTDLETLWNGICPGRSGIGPIRNFDATGFRCRVGGEIINFNPAPHLDAKEARRHSRFAQFAVVASEQAVADSGLEIEKEDPYRCGVIIGSGFGGS